MCGIAGIIGEDINGIHEPILQAMGDALHHRGPDGDALWINASGNAGFAHRRLAIIDLSPEAAQPMHYLNRYTIVYNGEIYNYIELKKFLEKQGLHFHTSSDTEVILAAFHFYGEKLVDHLEGMFAFAIWDDETKILFAARDRFGEKPFYYYIDEENRKLVFASEMKGLWAAGILREADQSMLLNYLTIGFTQNPRQASRTFYKGIVKLPPAHYLQFDFSQKKLFTGRYWQILLSEKERSTDSFENCVETFNQLFTDSVKRRLRSDVAIGTSLSGGLDSSSVVAVIMMHLQDQSHIINNSNNLKTFSAVFPGFKKDEGEYIDIVKSSFSIQNYQVVPSANDLVADFEKICYHQEEPFASAGIEAQYSVYQSAQQHGIKVLLDGQGADETLGGYEKYFPWYLQEMRRQPGSREFKDEKNKFLANGYKVSWSTKNYFASSFPILTAVGLQNKLRNAQRKNENISRDFLINNMDHSFFYKPEVRSLNDILYHDTFTMGLEELLRYADRNSMAHGVEVRLPFLDHHLVTFLFSLPARFKIKDGLGKFLLRSAMKGFLPGSIVWRTDKIGFEAPQKSWMENERVREMIHESKKKLFHHKIITDAAMQHDIHATHSYEANNQDWRYLSSAFIL